MPIPGLQGCGSSSLLLDSFQNPQSSILNWTATVKVPGRSTHPLSLGYYDCDHHNRHHLVSAANSQDLTRSKSPSARTMAGTPSGRHHKPRRKVKQDGDGKGFQLSKAETLVRTPSFPLSAFLWPVRGSVSQWEVLPLILMVVGLFRWAAGLWGYSGE